MRQENQLTPSAAHPQGAPALVTYRLRCAASGRSAEFDAFPTPLDVQTTVVDLFLFGHPSDVTARALAEAVVERPGEVARYGSVWSLEVVT